MEIDVSVTRILPKVVQTEDHCSWYFNEVARHFKHCCNANSEAPSCSPKSNPPTENGPRTRVNKRNFGCMPVPTVGKSSKYAPPNYQQIQENNGASKNNSPPGKNLFIYEKGKISNANAHGENIATNGAVNMINSPSYTHLLSDFGNATSYLGENFDGIAQQFIEANCESAGQPFQQAFLMQMASLKKLIY